ncbi:hypothetical protein B0T19DRAFT_451394 [Cercophora scortea]|uniref:Uncharacterized protein n=1 Tax=Cercophora scortea TaxID=314031 RepID=A0AAE0I980_9PEZI|nr:hypothetical protein B0T19DRAFT_451394 [Cercophora scortea]
MISSRLQSHPSGHTFATEVLGTEDGKEEGTIDPMPASYHYYDASGKHVVANPAADIPAFLQRELSVGALGDMLEHLWFAGARRPATPLQFHVAMGREIMVADRMDLHLLWDNGGRLFLKPVTRFLLDPTFWRNNLRCPNACACRGNPRKVALGFLYTYACQVHPRFHRAELPLSRVNTIHRFTRLPPFNPYLRSRRNYGSLFRDNLAWIAAATVFIALLLTAMQVGLATERLQGNADFQRASYGFAIFATLAPICAFGLVVLWALFNLIKDLPWLLGGKAAQRYRAASASV